MSPTGLLCTSHDPILIGKYFTVEQEWMVVGSVDTGLTAYGLKTSLVSILALATNCSLGTKTSRCLILLLVNGYTKAPCLPLLVGCLAHWASPWTPKYVPTEQIHASLQARDEEQAHVAPRDDVSILLDDQINERHTMPLGPVMEQWSTSQHHIHDVYETELLTVFARFSRKG